MHRYHLAHIDANDLLLKTSAGADYLWAVECLYRAARTDPEFCWKVVVLAAHSATSDIELSYIASGPLEDLMTHHRNEYRRRVDDLSKTDEVIHKLALNLMW